MIDVVEEFPPNTPQRALRLDALNAMLEQRKDNFRLADAGDRIVVLDSAGVPIRTIEKGAEPLGKKDEIKAGEKENKASTAYANTMRNMQSDYDAAIELYNHPGIEDITGRFGRLVGDAPTGQPSLTRELATTIASSEGRAAFNLWQRVTGGTFLAGLTDLKAASPVGSTGLGQVSNIEGNKVQSAKAALNRDQDAPDFRKQLAGYVKSFEDAAAAMAAAAERDGLQPIALQRRPLTGPAGARSRRTAQPAQPPSPGHVRMRAPDGREAWIAPDKVEAARTAGAVEVK
jgi:hypothetical protein